MAPKPFLLQLSASVWDIDKQQVSDCQGMLRNALIDTIGCILSGVHQEVAALSREAIAHSQRGSSPVWGTGLLMDAETAAFLNAVSGHALELDDWEIPGNTHPSVVMVPAILAAAENHLGFEEFCLAYGAGFEVIARLGEAMNFQHYDRGWHTTSTLASIGAAAAVAKLWRLGIDETCSSLSLAVTKAAGLTRQFGSHAKALHAGFAAENAIRCVRLAKAGLTAQSDVLEGRRGYFELAGHDDARAQQNAYAKIGQELALKEYGLIIKAYPSCGYTHRTIDAAIQIPLQKTELDLVEKVIIELPDFHAAILPFKHPQSIREALFSLPFCTAMGLLYDALTMDHVRGENWNEVEVKKVIDLCTIEPFKPDRPELNYDENQPDRVTVIFKDRSKRTAAVAYPLGAPQSPISEQQLLTKFLENCKQVCVPENSDFDEFKNINEAKNIIPLINTICSRKS